MEHLEGLRKWAIQINFTTPLEDASKIGYFQLENDVMAAFPAGILTKILVGWHGRHSNLLEFQLQNIYIFVI